MTKVTVTIKSEVKLLLKSGLRNNSKTTQANLKKLHGKIKHSEMVSLTQNLGQGQKFKVKAIIRGRKSNNLSAIT